MRLLLAPMEGVVDWVMRDFLTRIGGIDHCVTEFQRVTTMLLPDHVFYKTSPELQHQSLTPAKVPVFFQLLGGQAEPIALNAQRLCEIGAIGIDLNFGCPAPTVNRHDGGATLLKNPQRLFHIIKAVRNSIPSEIPVTAKVRLGFDHKDSHLEIAQAAQEGGAQWLVVHARTKTDGYKPPAYWEYIARMREAVSIPVIGNGEVWSVEDYFRLRDISGCEDVMIGRGALSNPFLFLEIKESLLQKQKIVLGDWPKMAVLLHEFYNFCTQARGEKFAINRTKQWLRYLGRHFPESDTLFKEIKIIVNGMEFHHKLEQERSLHG